MEQFLCNLSLFVNPFKPKYLEWYKPCLDLEHTIPVYEVKWLTMIYRY